MLLPRISGYLARATALIMALIMGYCIVAGFFNLTSWRDILDVYYVLAIFAELVFLLVSVGVLCGIKSGLFRLFAIVLSFGWVYGCVCALLAPDLPDQFFPRRFGTLFLVMGSINAVALIGQDWEFIQLVFRQMRQRALSTSMTIVLVLLGVGLAIAVMIVRRESEALFGQTDFGYEFILGAPKASDEQLVFNTVYNIGKSPGNIPYKVWEDMAHSPKYLPNVRWAIPILVGDTYQGRGDRRIVGTSPQMFGYRDDGKLVPDNNDSHPFEYRVGKTYELDESRDSDKDGKLIVPRMFKPRRFEAVLGSEVAKKDNFHLYDDKLTEAQNEARHAVFQATHGMPAPTETPDIHKPKWHVVGILKQTHTASDRVLYVPVISLYAIEEHDIGLLAIKLTEAGYEPFQLPPDRAEQIMRSIGINPDELQDATRRKFHVPPKGSAPTTPPAAAPSSPSSSDGGELLRDKTPATPKPAPAPAAPAAGEEDPDAYTLDKNGDIVPELPQKAWEVSAVLVKSRGLFQFSKLTYIFQAAAPEFTAANPAGVMREFFATFFKPSTYVMLAVSLLVTIVAAGSIVVGIYNSVAARMREIAILRALGATKQTVLGLICVEAGLIGLFGAVLGLFVGHGLGAIGSLLANMKLGQSINWIRIGWREDWYANEPLYLATVVVVAVLAGLVPALKAYSTSVATNLSAG